MAIGCRILFAILLTLSINEAQCFNQPDTITNWQIYYGDKLIVAGHEPNARVPDIATIHLVDSIKELKIVYRYCAGAPKWRTIEIKNGPDILYSAEDRLKDNRPHVLDLGELVDGKSGSFDIQIYYSDDITHEKDKLIGEIRIEM